VGIALRLRLTGDGAIAWLPVAKAHLAAINARPNASFIRNLMNYPGVVIEVVRGTVIDQINITILSGYLSVGWIGNEYRLVGSTEARGTFENRGSAGTDWSTVLRSDVLYYGKGLGMTKGTSYDTTGIGSTPDFDANALNAYHAERRTTRDGRGLTPTPDPFTFFGAYNSAGIMTAGWTLHTCYFKDGAGDTAKRKFMRGYSGLMMVGDQRGPFFIYDIEDEGRAYGATLFIPNQLAFSPITLMMGPGKFWMMNRYYRPDYLGSHVVVADCPGITFSYSPDAGRTWISSAAAIFDEFDTVRTLVPPTPASGNLFNQIVESVDLQAVMLTGTKAFLVANVPYCEMVGGTLTVKVKIKYGICDTDAAFSMTTMGVLYDGEAKFAPLAYAYMGSGGALLMTFPSAGEFTWGTGQLQFTEDGVTFENTGTMPFPAWATGSILAIDKKTLLCPMYDGDHSVYETQDRGATWTKRATLYKGLPPPDHAYPRLMQFSTLALLQNGGAPANQTPTAPWATDCQFEAPT
jgi:hypothetical protein